MEVRDIIRYLKRLKTEQTTTANVGLYAIPLLPIEQPTAEVVDRKRKLACKRAGLCRGRGREAQFTDHPRYDDMRER